MSAAAIANKLLQCSSGAVYTDDAGNWELLHDEKLDALDDVLEFNEQPVLLFYNFKSDLARLKVRYPFAVEMDKQGAAVEAWNRGEIRMLLAHPQSAGHGLNLQTGSNLCVWFSLPWSLEYYQQANARLFRQGQTKPVTILHIVCQDTIDERVLKVLALKDVTQTSLLAALKP
jgi:SNF2 family DNA or RNA helicase